MSLASVSPEILGALREGLRQQMPHLSEAHFEPMATTGLAHHHVRLCGTGWLARIPIQSQMQLAALENLQYQIACFERASAGGYAPRSCGYLPPTLGLPRGAVIVEEIMGTKAILPDDLPVIATGLAAMHRLEVPQSTRRSPLIASADPLRAMWDEVDAQAQYLPRAGISAYVHGIIKEELQRFAAHIAAPLRPMVRLIVFDGHPGNFVVQRPAAGVNVPTKKAVLVDLEKCRYSYPSFDLAHATLYTSTTWDVESHCVLTAANVMSGYRAWHAAVDVALAEDAQRWHLPLRRAMWLWSVTWCAKWRVASKATADGTHRGEDWSTQNIDSSLVRHVRERVDHYLSDDCVAWVENEFSELSVSFSGLIAA